ncbi:MAG: hypothetical protein NTW96_16710 [Planctomycetia bacterium]|nr:hypothetical protein [Planctomycetia bacterium]
MSHTPSCRAERVPAEFANLWVAWDRNQTRIVASGPTFDEAKRAAAATGHRAIILAKVAPAPRRGGRSLSVVYAVAVFMAQVAPLLTASS